MRIVNLNPYKTKKQKKKLTLEAFAEKAEGQILTKPATKAVKGGEGAQVEFIVEEDLMF